MFVGARAGVGRGRVPAITLFARANASLVSRWSLLGRFNPLLLGQTPPNCLWAKRQLTRAARPVGGAGAEAGSTLAPILGALPISTVLPVESE